MKKICILSTDNKDNSSIYNIFHMICSILDEMFQKKGMFQLETYKSSQSIGKSFNTLNDFIWFTFTKYQILLV